MHLLVAINCSARKTAEPISYLRARSLPRGSLSELASEWRARRFRAKTRVPAHCLYTGRGFSLAYEAAKTTGAQLHIVSAGMGLLHPETAIPPYSLTLSPKSPDSILRRAFRTAAFTSEEWWQAVRSETPAAGSLEQLLSAFPKGLLLLALTYPYLNMISPELKALTESDRDRVRIIGVTQPRLLPEALRPNVMPYDPRLNAVDRPMRGTAFDFSSRALVHFVNLVKFDKRIEDTASHARRVRQSLAHWSAPKLNPRKRIDDASLIQSIRALKAQNLSRTAGLRYLRRKLGLACEQERFAIAWNCV